jgi:hypothetical protein
VVLVAFCLTVERMLVLIDELEAFRVPPMRPLCVPVEDTFEDIFEELKESVRSAREIWMGCAKLGNCIAGASTLDCALEAGGEVVSSSLMSAN